MTEPRLEQQQADRLVLACLCGHAKQQHGKPGFPPRCAACTCRQYRPATPAGTAQLAAVNDTDTTAGTPLPTIEQLLAAAQRSPSRRILALADKVNAVVTDLRARLREERETAQARQEIAELEDRLAAVKAKLRSRAAPTTNAQDAAAPAPEGSGEFACPDPDCGQSFDTPQGRGAHRAHKHGYRRGGAA
jgi:hypothetical protein